MAVQIGDHAPEASLTNTEGEPVELSDFWHERPILLVLLRHLGCTFCREQVALLRRDALKFHAAGAEIICVAQGDYKTGKAFSILFDMPFPLLLCGDDLTIYQSYGLGRGTFSQLFGWQEFIRGVNATLHGYILSKVIGDGFQMPGVFLIDTCGVIRFVHRHRNAADNPNVQVLLQEVRNLTANQPAINLQPNP